MKIAYSFGRNPHFQQKGSTSGKLLGDATSPLVARHIHGLAYNPVENAFYTCTDDINRGNGNECHWLRGTYDTKTDNWDWMVLVGEIIVFRLILTSRASKTASNGSVYFVTLSRMTKVGGNSTSSACMASGLTKSSKTDDLSCTTNNLSDWQSR